jgi:hypothetical protein
MSRVQRILVGLAALLIGGLIWIPCLHLFFARSAPDFHSRGAGARRPGRLNNLDGGACILLTVHIAGLRDYTCILNGTVVSPEFGRGLSAFLGLASWNLDLRFRSGRVSCPHADLRVSLRKVRAG